MCWCVYDLFIKDYVYAEDTFVTFLKYANFIILNTNQKPNETHFYNPYVLTIVKVVKIYKNKPSTNYKEMISWLKRLNPNILSEDEFVIEDEINDKEYEQASLKEFYYQYITRAYEKNEEYDNCIYECEQALKIIKNFHYGNEVWFKARLYFSKCKIDLDDDKSFEEYKTIAEKEKHWFMYHKLSELYLQKSFPDYSLLYACKSFNCRFDEKGMINLILDIGNLWLNHKNNRENARKFYQACAYYRDFYEWSIPEDLAFAVDSMEIDIKVKPIVKELKKITEKYVDDNETKTWYYGKILNIVNDRAGFIVQDNEKDNIYFKKNDLYDKSTFRTGVKVKYQKDEDKQNRPYATNIRSVL